MTNRCGGVWSLILLSICLGASGGDTQGLIPSGPQPVVEALDPTLMKWYQPQELYNQYRWSWWNYSNYARQSYRRYVDVGRSSSSFDLFLHMDVEML